MASFIQVASVQVQVKALCPGGKAIRSRAPNYGASGRGADFVTRLECF